MRNNGGTYRARRRHRQGEVEEPDRQPVGVLSRLLGRAACSSASLSGKVMALRARNGKLAVAEAARPAAPSHRRSCAGASSTSAPRAATLYALFAKTGRVKWKFSASRRDQGLARAVRLDALLRRLQRPHVRGLGARRHAGAGRPAPRARSSGSRPGNFYSTPRSTSAASTPATPTARSTRSARSTGTLAWSQSTGGYVYSSPAVANVPGTPADRLHRLLRRQPVRARRAHRHPRAGPRAAGGRISGGPSVVGRIVYFADLDSKTTYGVDAAQRQARLQRTRAATTTPSSPTAAAST